MTSNDADAPDALVEIQIRKSMDLKIIWMYVALLNTVLYVTVVVTEYIFTIYK